ncbi:MAG: hypothetical protein MUD01_26005 [Chloroflexaceae bacterium]|jgi:hypothetical protein|nr:hypothetical protein [Chloroflexaceae bacterium]
MTTLERDLVGWLRDTTPQRVIGETVQLLREGVPEDDLWAAGALAACRYLNCQARNLLGFVSHAMIGCEDARQLAAGQPQRTRQLLLIQALYQVVCDRHDPCFAPFELLPFWPHHEKTVAENLQLFRSDVRFGEYMRVDHRFVGLAETLSREELIDLLLDVGLEGMVTDDHTLISPFLCLGMIDLVGWERGFDMLRWCVRYSASFPRDFGPYDRATALLKQYGLENGAPGESADSGTCTDEVLRLRAAFLAAEPARRPELVARALAEGTAPQSILAAASLAVCDMYLMTDPVPHDDYDAVSREVAPIHIGTTINCLRSVLAWMSPRTRALATIQAGSLLERGPSVLNEVFEFVPFVPSRPYPYAEDVEPLQGLEPDQLLATLQTALFARDHRKATAAVRAYADTGADAEALITLITDAACTDNGTLLHNYKHLHAMVDEFRACNHPDRWNFLIAAARWISWYAGKWTEAYDEAVRELGD